MEKAEASAPEVSTPLVKGASKTAPKELTKEEKIAISKKYLPASWVGDEDIKKIRGSQFSDLRRRARGEDF